MLRVMLRICIIIFYNNAKRIEKAYKKEYLYYFCDAINNCDANK